MSKSQKAWGLEELKLCQSMWPGLQAGAAPATPASGAETQVGGSQ